MADQEGPTPKVLIRLSPGYRDLLKDERLAAAEELAARLQEGLPPRP
jgi:hypothetical protein